MPLHDYQPVQSGWTRKRRFGTNLAGTWTGTERANPYLVIADNYNIQKESWESAESDPESNHYGRPDRLLAQSVLHGFGMTYAQACNHGFSPFNDPTAPFTGNLIYFTYFFKYRLFEKFINFSFELHIEFTHYISPFPCDK